MIFEYGEIFVVKSLISRSRSQSNEIALLFDSMWLIVDEVDDDEDEVEDGDELYFNE